MTTSSNRMAEANHLCLALGLAILMWGAAGQVLGSVNRLGQEAEAEAAPEEICDACVQFATEAQMILSDPDTQQQAIDLISQVACESLTPRLEAKCLDLVNHYVSDAFRALQAYVGPDICLETRICRDFYITTRGGLLDRPRWAADKTCALCQDFASDALTYLESNATQSKIIDALHLACARLHQFSHQCDLLVDMYAPEFMEQLTYLTPEDVCEIPHLCTTRREPASLALASSRGLSSRDCTFCQFVVLEVKLKLRDPVTQERLLEVLFNGCDRVPHNHVDECKEIVIQYAPFILANLDTILDADALCSRIKACPVAKLDDAVESVLASVLDRPAHHYVSVLAKSAA